MGTMSVYSLQSSIVPRPLTLTGHAHPGDDTDADRGFYRRIVNIIWKGFIFHDYMKYDTLFPIVIILIHRPPPPLSVSILGC